MASKTKKITALETSTKVKGEVNVTYTLRMNLDTLIKELGPLSDITTIGILTAFNLVNGGLGLVLGTDVTVDVNNKTITAINTSTKVTGNVVISFTEKINLNTYNGDIGTLDDETDNTILSKFNIKNSTTLTTSDVKIT